MKLIVNADDFGINRIVSDQIIELISKGKVTSTSIIANGPDTQRALKQLPLRSDYSFGVHLNLTEFQPLTPSVADGSLSVLLDNNNCFAGEEVLRKAKLSQETMESIFTELCLQVERVLAYGIKISHFDSHHHVHTIPRLFLILKRLQKKYKIRKVRNTWNIYPISYCVPLSLRCKKALWSYALRHYYPTTTTSGFTSLLTFHQLMQNTVIHHNTVEVMTHPGNPDFENETKLLYTSWQSEILSGIEMISFSRL
jgi:predicted glycoside hydrolase/deacetylase ChbG (UPF0249 family)